MKNRKKLSYPQARRLSDTIFFVGLVILLISQLVSGWLRTPLVVLGIIVFLAGGAVAFFYCVCPECGHVLPRYVSNTCPTCGEDLTKHEGFGEVKSNGKKKR